MILSSAAQSQTLQQRLATSPPPQRCLQARHSEEKEAPARRAVFKRKFNGITVIEGARTQAEDCTDSIDATSETCGSQQKHARTMMQQVETPEAALRDALVNLPPGFAEDFFLGQGCAKLNQTLAANAASRNLDSDVRASEERPRSERFAEWAELLKMGFSLLVHGVGSKKQLLQDFAEEMLKPSGVLRVHIHAFDARFSLIECLKGLLEKAYPDKQRVGNSADSLGASVRAAVASGSRPLCFIVHNLELLPQNHVVILASLAASPGVHLVASVDSIAAAWDARCLKDFNFCREECHTFLGYEVEAAARFFNGLPPWTGLGHDKGRSPKACLSLVLRSLTNNHRELVQAMARKQLESGKGGVSFHALLKESTDRMIAGTVTKLRSLMNELRDHEVVIQRNSSSSAAGAQVLFSLPYDDRVLAKLAESANLDSDDEAEEVVAGNDILEDDEDDVLGVSAPHPSLPGVYS